MLRQKKRSRMRRRTLLACNAVLLIAGCGPKPPQGLICLYDAPRSQSICYEMSKDFDKDGTLKPGAPQQILGGMTADKIDKHTHFSPEAWGSVRKWLGAMREQCKR